MKTTILMILLVGITCVNTGHGQTTGLQFDGTNDYVIVPHNNAYDIGYGNFTFEAVVSLDPVQTASNFPALLSTRSSGDNSGFLLFFFNGELSLQTDGVNHNSSPNGDIRDGQCHHVAVVRSSTSLLSWYIDGQLTTTDANANLDITTSSPMIIGNDFYSGAPSSGAFKGTIQEVRVWNVARSQSELQSEMNKNITGSETGLIGYWRLNDGSGQTVIDRSSTNNTATLGSGASADASDPIFATACPITGLAGVEEFLSNDNSFVIYPNPLTSTSAIEFNTPVEDAELVVYDILGKEVVRKIITGVKTEINKGDLEKGTYLVKVKNKGIEYLQKIIVE